jgi:flagellar hook-basal body complex protein FliE
LDVPENNSFTSKGIPMATELAGLIQADLAALTNAASRLQVAPAADGAAPGQAGFSFAQTMKDAVIGADNEALGAMLASQQADLSFSLLLQVRNKVMGAVDELLKLPV